MELRQLKAFCTVARELSFTRAAEILDYTQSSVTTQIQSLEEVSFSESGHLIVHRKRSFIVQD